MSLIANERHIYAIFKANKVVDDRFVGLKVRGVFAWRQVDEEGLVAAPLIMGPKGLVRADTIGGFLGLEGGQLERNLETWWGRAGLSQEFQANQDRIALRDSESYYYLPDKA